MNKQRKVVITTTYNEMGIIIDTKAEEVAKPDLQPTCNGLATDCISRQAAIDVMCELMNHWFGGDPKDEIREIKRELEKLPSAQPEVIRCRDCKYWREHKYAKETKRYIPFCGFNAIYTKADDFCSRAERRTDECTD